MPLHIERYIPYQVVDERVWGQVTIEDVHQHTDCMLQILTEAQTHAPGTTIYQLFDDFPCAASLAPAKSWTDAPYHL
jgi:hypothetical protein